MGRAMVELYCSSFRQVPRRIVLDIDDTFDAVHGGQQLRLFNAYYDEYGFQPIVVFDGEGRPVAAMLRPAKRPSGHEARAFLRRLVRAIRAHWPRVEILLRADSHYCSPEVLDFCRAERLDFILGVAPTSTLRRHVEALEQSTAARQVATPDAGKRRRYKEFLDGAASWSRVERIIARVEVGAQGIDTRFVVTNLSGGSARTLYERSYCQRGQAENHVKAWKLHLAADRTSCRRATANQFRLLLHTGAYWLHVVAAQPDAEALGLARGAVRHAPPATGETRRPCGRAEDPGPATPALRLSLARPCCASPSSACRSSSSDRRGVCPVRAHLPRPTNPAIAPSSRPKARRR